MRAKFKLILLFTALFISFFSVMKVTASSEYDWNMVRDEDGIQVYLKSFWADDIKAFRGVIHVDSSLDSILAVIMDIDACSDWVHHCIKPMLLKKISYSENYHYQIHHLPFPAQDREFIFHSKVSRSTKSGAVSIQINAVPEFCHNNHQCTHNADASLVRVEHSHGHYLLEPISKQYTRVTWTQHTNPGGNLPSWLINSLVKEMPYFTLQGLRKKVFAEKYQKAKLILNSEGEIINMLTSQ